MCYNCLRKKMKDLGYAVTQEYWGGGKEFEGYAPYIMAETTDGLKFCIIDKSLYIFPRIAIDSNADTTTNLMEQKNMTYAMLGAFRVRAGCPNDFDHDLGV